MKLEVRNSLLLLLTALIWGVAFVAQRQGGAEAGPYTFNCIRSLLGAVVLLPVLSFLDRHGNEKKPRTAEDKRLLITGGVLCGIVLFVSSTVQQLGLYYGTTAGKAGFLTACYILLVPILGIFLGRKCGWNVWVSVVVALVGLYFLCLTSGFSFQFSDALVLLCAVCFSVHIMVVDHFSPLVDGVRMACIQFLTCGLLGVIPMLAVDMWQAGLAGWLQSLGGVSVWIAILYAGVMSCGVAYTLQIVGQNGLNPTVASLLMSLESVFSALAGALILQERMSRREVLGSVLVFAAVLFAQIDFSKKSS
ncbi:MAG: DMT family transporter [Lachnospiraceae bacterium]|nr:DMT family transporter [Lachnospiraceae bacterium]